MLLSWACDELRDHQLLVKQKSLDCTQSKPNPVPCFKQQFFLQLLFGKSTNLKLNLIFQVELFYAKISRNYVRWLSLGLCVFCFFVKYRHWFNTFPFHLHSQDVVNNNGPAGIPSVKNFCTDSEPSPILTAPVQLLPVLEVPTKSFSPGYPATCSTHLCL